MSLLRNFFIRLSNSHTTERFVQQFGPARGLARRFVAGETVDEAIAVVKTLNQQGLKAILNEVGESVTTQAEATAAADIYQELLHRVHSAELDATITVKPSHLGLAFGLDFFYETVADIVQTAQNYGILVEIDIEDSPDVPATLDVYHRLLDTFGGGVRQAIQSYLHRTPADVHRIIEHSGNIRLVKGAYQETPDIAIQDTQQINEASIDLIKAMLTKEAVDNGAYLALGSHDPVLIEALLTETKNQNLQPDQFEIQMLLGIRRDEQQRLANLGYQVRVYVPFGQAWYPYFMRRLAERPANILFMLRAAAGR